VLTVSEEEHAHARAAPGPQNKGGEAARAAVATARLLQSLRARPARRGRKIV
jgi:6,7-dimethyl-8-ribityllumazine synthase